MVGFHFFLEYKSSKDKRKATRKSLGDHSGNVIAVGAPKVWVPGPNMNMECISAVFDTPNSDVCGSQCSWDYLRTQCLRISEAQAREIHPKLFACLDD